MAEMQLSDTRKRRGSGRGKKLSTRVDLTPMVDLGFLLITFFIFTTTLSEAKAMHIIVPDEKPVKNPSLAPVSKTISLILAGDNTIYYYHGLAQNEQHTTNYSPSGIRKVLQEKIRMVNQLSGKPGQTIVLIKPTPECSYRNVVDALDEMLINGVSRYVLMEPAEGDIPAGHR